MKIRLPVFVTLLVISGTFCQAQGAIRLPTNRAVILTVGPFVDFSDGVTPETAMTVTNITACLTKDSDAGGAGVAPTIVLNATLTASGGSNDMVHLTGDTVGLYSLEMTAAQLNFVGRGRLVLSDPDVMCPWWTDIIVEPNNVYDSTVAGTDYQQVDALQINSVAASSVTTINANLGTTQPVNYTGTGATAYVKVDLLQTGGSNIPVTVASVFSDVPTTGEATLEAAVQSGLTTQGYTVARAPYLDELAAANLPADVDTLKTRVSQTIPFVSLGGTQTPQVSMTGIIGTALTETAGGYLAAAFKKFFDVAAPVLTTASVNQTGDNYSAPPAWNGRR